MKFSNKKLFLIFFFSLILSFEQDFAFASYDIVRAKTIDNSNFIQENENDEELIVKDSDFSENYQTDTLLDKVERNVRSFIDKRRKNKINKQISEDVEILDDKDNKNVELSDEFDDDIQQEEVNEISPLAKTDDVQVVDDNNKFRVNADYITYNDEDGNVYADGHVEIIPNAKNVKLVADKAVLNRTEQTIKLYDNVKIIKDNTELKGQYLLVDLNEQNVLVDNPIFSAYSFTINAQEGYLIANDIQMLNGTVRSQNVSNYKLTSKRFMTLDDVSRLEDFDENIDIPQSKSSRTYRIDVKEAVITSYKNHNSLLLKGSNIYYKNHKIVRNSDIEIISDKKNQVIETSAPEAGNLRNFGSYIGYGLLYRMPFGHTFRITPVVALGDSNLGVGAIMRYKSQNNIVEGGWNTATTNAVIRGKYRMNDYLTFNYGRNAYIPESFLGSRRSGYAGQFEFKKTYRVKDLDAVYKHGIHVGLFSDYAKHDQEDAYSTTRFRYLSELRKTLYQYRNKDHQFAMRFDGSVQGAATVYGSGETTGIIRVGPRLFTRYKGWESQLGYYISGVHGDSPFLFDKYRYGKSVVMLNEKFNVNNKFAFGFRVYVSPMKDNYEEDLLTESSLYVVAGPDDLKLALSYDFVRDIAHVDFMFLLGNTNSTINFDKLITKNMEDRKQKQDFFKNAKPVKIVSPENI